MSADVDNPYESPSLAVSEEANVPPTCFNARERRAIERFIWVNQIVAGCVITISVVMPVAYSIGFASGVSGISFAELVRFSAIMAVVLAVGIFQANKNIYSITATGFLAVLILLYLFFLILLALISWGGGFLLASLPCLIPPVLLLWPPIWVTMTAWYWRLRGVDLQAIAKVKFIDVSRPSFAHFGGGSQHSAQDNKEDAAS